MNRTFIRTLSLVAVVAAAVAAAPYALRAQADVEARVVTIEGKVEIGDVDEDGTALSVYVWDPSEGAVLIRPAGKGRELLKHVGAVVQATGTVRPRTDDFDYDYEMELQSFEVLEPAEEDVLVPLDTR